MNCQICLKAIKTSKYPEYHDACLRNFFGSVKVNPYLDFSPATMSVEALAKVTEKMSISGVQQKLSVRVEDKKILPTDRNGEFILKPTPSDNRFEMVSENEHLSMLICRHLGVESVPFGLFRLPNGTKAYMIKRFDKGASNRIHCEDFCQIMNINKTPDGSFKYESSYEEVGRKMLECTGGNKAVVYEFMKRLIINFLIQNGDYHLKNISLQVLNPAPEMIFDGMTPNYDSLNTRLYMKDDVFALDLLANKEFTAEYEKLGFYTKADFYELGKRIGINRNSIDEIISAIGIKEDEIRALIDASYLSSSLKETYSSLLFKRMDILKS